MRVEGLEGEALDLWVAKAEGYKLVEDPKEIGQAALGIGPAVLFKTDAGDLALARKDGGGKWSPSTDWAQGGPIIEHEKLNIWPHDDEWCASYTKDLVKNRSAGIAGPTPLIAAMRAYVCSVFGEEVGDAEIK